MRVVIIWSLLIMYGTKGDFLAYGVYAQFTACLVKTYLQNLFSSQLAYISALIDDFNI